QRLAQADPTNAQWQDDLLISYRRTIEVSLTQEQVDLSRKWLDGLNGYLQTLQQQFPEKISLGLEFGNLSFYYLQTKDPKKALSAAQKGLEIAPEEHWINTNLAHAYMYIENLDDAEKIYLKFWGTTILSKLWQDAIKEDFEVFRQAGLAHPFMDVILEKFRQLEAKKTVE
ncbi:MAG: hypothetical protein KDJ99_20805, partial [Candidatus Competibacteraceae bacterium]|nr:hypothetical protein [Candidatus Competibacteraceae bacterium]